MPYHTGLLQLYGQVYDHYRRGDCQINIAEDCGQGRIGGLTNMMVLRFGAFILVFRCCESCDLAAREAAAIGYKLGVIEAHERLGGNASAHVGAYRSVVDAVAGVVVPVGRAGYRPDRSLTAPGSRLTRPLAVCGATPVDRGDG